MNGGEYTCIWQSGRSTSYELDHSPEILFPAQGWR